MRNLIGKHVYGPLIPASAGAKIIAIGEDYEDVEQYDTSRAMAETIRFTGNQICVAVKFLDGRTAVYPATEVWEYKNR